jgi:hypothetical protein
VLAGPVDARVEAAAVPIVAVTVLDAGLTGRTAVVVGRTRIARAGVLAIVDTVAIGIVPTRHDLT